MRKVVVTGGTRGIGLAIADALMDAGYGVVVVARKPPVFDTPEWVQFRRLEDLGCAFMPCDLSKIETLKDFVHEVVSHHGEIYGLVNNAGIGTSGILATMPERQIEQVMQMNVVSPITLTKYIVRSMMRSTDGGRVVNISSIVANTGYVGLSAYSASKAALLGFTRSLAREVGPVGITVNAVAPGFIATDMTHGLTDKQREQIARRSALHRMASAPDIANTIVFLMGDQAANITGTVLTVDAGNTV